MKRMKVAECRRYGPPEVLVINEADKPVPGNNEILVRMHATAVTASDCIVRGFKLRRWSFKGMTMGLIFGFKKPRHPVLGMIVSGIVESTGKQVTHFKEGDSVYGWTLKGIASIQFGTYAEYKCLPENSTLVIKPDTIDFEQAAAIPYGGLIALYFLKKAKIQERKNVMIYGASGAIGTAAVQLAKFFGAEVTGVCSTSNLQMIKDLGADNVLDYTQDTPAETAHHFDLILDAAGKNKDSEFKQKCKEVLASNGFYISIDDGAPTATSGDLEMLNNLIKEGRLKAVIDRIYPFSDIVEAHRHADTGHKKGNIILKII